MNDAPLDLVDCSREPVHAPGAVQPHAAFLAIELRTGSICAASASFLALVDGATEALSGADPGAVFDDASTAHVRALADGARIPRPQVLVLRNGRRLNALGYLSDGLLMLDIEPVAEFEFERLDAAMLDAEAALRIMAATPDTDVLRTVLVEAVARVTGFDRVMLYEFDREWNGSVVAEARGPAARGSFLDLKFPSSDIPAQARALSLRNRVRQIVDVEAEPSPILPDRHPTHGGPLDLSDSQVRAVSPIHLRYLRNMGVRASFVIALIRQDVLWGLLSCQHSQGPLCMPVRLRALCGLLGDTFSGEIWRREVAELAARRRMIAERLDPLTSRASAVAKASAGAGFATFMKGVEPTLLDLAATDALWLSVGDRTVSLGAAPEPDRVAALVSAAEGLPPTSDKYRLRLLYRAIAYTPVLKRYSPVLFALARQRDPKPRQTLSQPPSALFDEALSIEE